MLTFAPLTFLLYVISPWALYFTGWYDATLHSSQLHELMHLHLVVVGALFFTPILGVDPVPGRVSHPFRLLLLILTLPFHAFLGVTIMSQTELIGGDWYPSLHDSMSWLPDPHDDQHLAGGILWGAGDLIAVCWWACCSSSGCVPRWPRHDARTAGSTAWKGPRRARRPAMGTPRPTGSICRVTSQTEYLKVLVYSDDVDTREQVILALGRRPHPDLPELEYVEVATEPVVIQQMDAGGIALAILDGEAVPAGGMGIARQLKDEIYHCPPLLVLTGRVQDNWLATWSRADAAVSHPLDPIELAETVVRLLLPRVPAKA